MKFIYYFNFKSSSPISYIVFLIYPEGILQTTSMNKQL